MIENKLVYGVIPARYASTRLPGKPLADINGHPMIYYVYKACQKSKYLDKIIVATDDLRVKEAVEAFNGIALMTSEKINTGTDRCFNALENEESKPSYVVNIQGDEPLIIAELIDKAIEALHYDKKSVVSTPVKKITDESEITDPNIVKAILNKYNQAIYFSRSPIPYKRNQTDIIFYKHIGLYVYSFEFLSKMVEMEQSILEKTESLEQLRIIENGYKISCFETDYDAIGVDTIHDLEKVKKIVC